MKNIVFILCGFLFVISCSSDEVDTISNSQSNNSNLKGVKNSLELNLSDTQMQGESFERSLEKLYSNVLDEIASDMKSIINNDVIIEFVVSLDKKSNCLYVEDMRYMTEEGIGYVRRAGYFFEKWDEETGKALEQYFMWNGDIFDACPTKDIIVNSKAEFNNYANLIERLVRQSTECLKQIGNGNASKVFLTIGFIEKYYNSNSATDR